MRFIIFSLLALFATLSAITCVYAAPTADPNKRYKGTISWIGEGHLSLTDSSQRTFVCDQAELLISERFQVGMKVTFIKKKDVAEQTAFDVQLVESPGTISWIKSSSNSVSLTDHRGRTWVCDDGKNLKKKVKVGDYVLFERKSDNPQTAYNVKKVSGQA